MNCLICGRKLDDPDEPINSRDCGGDCLQCMADCGDPDCLQALVENSIELTSMQEAYWIDLDR